MKIRNVIGVLIVRYVIHNDLKNNTEGWLVNRKNGTQQVIKVFSRQAYENIVRPALRTCKKNEGDKHTRKTNFDRCCESMEAMAQIIDIAKIGWTKDQIMEWLQKGECEVPE